ncbi:MAG: hypothetical protein QXP04_03495 [Candidatus Nanoarchaeia archaeon]|nr:hypothetical protein [Candidatus Jingweiarchaeum tengchongense]
MKTSTIVIAIIGIAIIGYLVYKYVYLPHKTSTSTTTTSITTPSTIPSTVSVSQYIPPSSSSNTSSTSSSSKSSYSLTSVTQNYYTPPSSGVYIPPKTTQIAYAQELACQRFPQLCAKEAPYIYGPVTIQTISQSNSSVHQSNPSILSTGIGSYARPMGGKAFNSW